MTMDQEPEPSASADKRRAKGYAYGISLMLASEVCWVTMNAMIKHLSDDYPAMQLLFFRNAVTIPVMLWLVMLTGGYSVLRTRRAGLHLIHALIGVTGMTCLIVSVSRLSLSDTVTITYAAPLFITALSVPFLKEKVGFRRWAAVIVGFAGVMVVARPDIGINPVILILLLGSLCFASTVIIRRHLSRTENSATVTLYYSIAGACAGGIAMPWVWVTPTAFDWMLLLVMGVIAALTQITLTMAIKEAPVSVLSPLLYLSLTIAVGADIVVWGVYPALTTIVGAGGIIIAGLYIIYRESGLGSHHPRDEET